nr:beta-fructofuranosidase, insoluble isoenzyme 4-like [Lolium perenne]
MDWRSMEIYGNTKDPNGPMYYNGIYHLFFQHNPNGPQWGDIVWGHSVSTDLVNWIILEPAIEPDTPGDIRGCWSGSATILFGGQPVIMYTGGDVENHQVQNIALPKNRSDLYLREWTKAGNNPVLQPVGPGMNPGEFRDPTTGWIGPDGLWRIAIGAEVNGYSAALLYKSEDFLNWSRVDHPLYSSSASTMWECLDFFAVIPGSNGGLDLSAAIPKGAKHVLKVSEDQCDE